MGNDKKALDLLTHCLETQKEIYGEKSLQVALTLLDKAKVEKKLNEEPLFIKDADEGLNLLETYFNSENTLIKKARLLRHS